MSTAGNHRVYDNRVKPQLKQVPTGFGLNVPTSMQNKYALYNFRGMYGNLLDDIYDNYYDMPNNPLMGGDVAQTITISKLIEFFQQYYPKIAYSAREFIYLKHFEKIELNQLITLRRFAQPINDNIFDLVVRDSKGQTGSDSHIAGVTACTYFGESTENKLEDLLKFTFGLKWKELKSQLETVESTDGGMTSQPWYDKIGGNDKIGGIGRAAADTMAGLDAKTKFSRTQYADGSDRFGTTYANFVIGPVNVINETMIRDTGLHFSNDITLNFNYELKSLNYVNPKIAMIDIISNMLTMTTNNAQFYGGGQRYYGAQGYVAKQFGDINKLRAGDFGGYSASVLGDVKQGMTNVFGNGSGGFDLGSFIDGVKSIGKNYLGNMLGGFLGGKVGSLQGVKATQALISAEPTGDWHVTIGNPLNPITMMGNMYCDSAEMILGNGLGYDDFPMEATFKVALKHGKPRDKGDIENMFNAGRGRIYVSAEGDQDLLNLAGADVPTYGSVKAGKNKFESTQSANLIKTTSPATNLKAGNAVDSDVTSEYVSSVVSMIIDS